MWLGSGLIVRGFLLFVRWGLWSGGVSFSEFLRGLGWWQSVLFVWRHYLNLVDSDVRFGNVLIEIDLLANRETVARGLDLCRPLEGVVIGEMWSSLERSVVAYFVRRWAQVGVKNRWWNEMGQVLFLRWNQLWALETVFGELLMWRWTRWDQHSVVVLWRFHTLESIGEVVCDVVFDIFRFIVVKLEGTVLGGFHLRIAGSDVGIFVRITLGVVLIATVEWREDLPVAIDVTRTACWYLENVHVQASSRIPAEQSVVVVDLNTTRAEVVCQVGTAVLRSSGRRMVSE